MVEEMGKTSLDLDNIGYMLSQHIYGRKIKSYSSVVQATLGFISETVSEIKYNEMEEKVAGFL